MKFWAHFGHSRMIPSGYFTEGTFGGGTQADTCGLVTLGVQTQQRL